MTAKVLNMSIRYIFLEREDGAIFLVFNPISRRILKQWSPFKNGDQILMYKDIDIVIPELLGKGWEYKEQGEYE